MINLVIYPSSPQGVSDAQAQELPVAKAINNYWAPIQTWSTIALSISQNGLALSAATTALLVALIIYRLILLQQEKTSLLTLYNKLPSETQTLIQAVKNAQKQNNPTTQGIVVQLEKLTNQPPDPTWLNQKLTEAETAGLIEKELVNKEDHPHLAWKNLTLQNNHLFSIRYFFKKMTKQL